MALEADAGCTVGEQRACEPVVGARFDAVSVGGETAVEIKCVTGREGYAEGRPWGARWDFISNGTHLRLK